MKRKHKSNHSDHSFYIWTNIDNHRHILPSNRDHRQFNIDCAWRAFNLRWWVVGIDMSTNAKIDKLKKDK